MALLPTAHPGPVKTTGPLSPELIDVTGRWVQNQHRLIITFTFRPPLTAAALTTWAMTAPAA